jgi:xanthoxin dehydrogenase
MAGRLEGKVAAITGASSGFGEGAARRFVAEGAKVALGDIQDDKGQAIADELGDDAIYVHCNVTVEDEVAGLIDAAVSAFGQLDIMYNNAGIIGAVGPFDTHPADEWKATLDVHVNGVFYGVKHAARVMKPRGTGSIVSMASTAAVFGGLGPHAYTAAKHAVVGITKAAAAELGHYGIRANAIGPAGMATPMVAAFQFGDASKVDEVAAELALASPLKGRAGLVEDVVNAALFLASDEAGYISGHTLMTDAGATIGAVPEGTAFTEHIPMLREAGKTGL